MRAAADRRFRLLVFDWDGTLSDSTTIIAEAIQSACRDLALPVPDDAAARYVIGLGLADAIRTVAPRLPIDRHAHFAQRYRDHYLLRENAIPLFAGAAEMLGELDDAGYLLAIATGKSRTGLEAALADSGLVGRFHATRCASDGQPKPHPEMLLHLMDVLATEPAETLMIGDTTHDLALAQNAGTDALAVAYGAHAADGFGEYNPLATVDSIEALRQWLRAGG